ncbi:hypothetical protein L6452_34399 [Arctium lappa]|uniref:Uncharacterized protein n=1 Tax=Arctium lappa TaxID=4217 RepID=A0ACB8YIN7_ARCLA|nr:hypothetical protein L6452_34399 [Arctium lappa]
MAEKLLMTHCSSFVLSPPITNGENNYPPITTTKIRLCAYGGANRLFDNMSELYPHEDNVSVTHERFKQDVIKGDLDSVRPDVKSFYENLVSRLYSLSSTRIRTSFSSYNARIASCLILA